MIDDGSVLAYPRIRAAIGEHPLRTGEIPVEHEMSLPLPTRRWGLPGFAVFAGAAVRRPRQPLRLSAPDRWLLVDAARARLIAYNLTSAVPFATAPLEGPVEVAPSGRTLAEVREDQKALGELIGDLAPVFLAGSAAAGDARRTALLHTLDAVLPAATRPWYEALTPDFFAWLKG
jgi:hypothetical protein